MLQSNERSIGVKNNVPRRKLLPGPMTNDTKGLFLGQNSPTSAPDKLDDLLIILGIAGLGKPPNEFELNQELYQWIACKLGLPVIGR